MRLYKLTEPSTIFRLVVAVKYVISTDQPWKILDLVEAQEILTVFPVFETSEEKGGPHHSHILIIL